MRNMYQTLRGLNGFIDNEYLLKYCRLIEQNTVTKQRNRVTNAHHVIPKAWYKINKQPVDNSLQNLVNLVYRNHVLAHYYLCLCTTNELQYANELALICLYSRNKLNIVDKQLFNHLPLYNSIYEDYKKKKAANYRLYR